MSLSRHRTAVLASSLLLGVAVPATSALAQSTAKPAATPTTAKTTAALKATVAADPVPTLASRLAAAKVAKTLN